MIHIRSQVKRRQSQSYKFKKKLPKIKIFKFCKKLYMRHIFCSCLIRCMNIKWIPLKLIIPIMETNLAIACIVIVWFVGGPAIADRSYPSAGSPALRILSCDVVIRRLLSSTMIMSFRYHSIRTNHNVVFWIKDTKKFSINISNLFDFWPIFEIPKTFLTYSTTLRLIKILKITSLNEHCCTLIRMSLTGVPILPI